MDLIDDEIKKTSIHCKSLELDELNDKGIIKINDRITYEEFNLLKLIIKNKKLKYIYIKENVLDQILILVDDLKNTKVIIDDEKLYTRYSLDNFIEYGSANNLTSIDDIEVFQVIFNFRDMINTIKKKYKNIINAYDNFAFVYTGESSKFELKDPEKRSISSKDFKDKEFIINMIIDEVNKLNLSPFEKYMYLYNIVKQYKEYKSEGDELSSFESRKNELLLFNQYYVCAGYVDFLVELIDRLNDPNLKAVEYTCLMSKNTDEGHMRCVVKIKDPKYNIDGIYLSDPTGDKIKGNNCNDYYYYILLTKKEMDRVDLCYDDNLIPDCSDVLFSKNSRFEDKDIPNISWSIAHYVNWKLNKSNVPIKDCKIDNRLNLESEPIDDEVIENAIREVYNKMYLPSPSKNIISRFKEKKQKELYEQFVDDIILANRDNSKTINDAIKKRI